MAPKAALLLLFASSLLVAASVAFQDELYVSKVATAPAPITSPAPSTTTPTKPITPAVPTPYVKPPTTAPPTPSAKPPTTTPPTKPSAPPTPYPKPSTPPTMPPAVPPVTKPNITHVDVKECPKLCDVRCANHSRPNLCHRACGSCCTACRCVPPGTYGNREMCGTCYTDTLTHGNRTKCP